MLCSTQRRLHNCSAKYFGHNAWWVSIHRVDDKKMLKGAARWYPVQQFNLNLENSTISPQGMREKEGRREVGDHPTKTWERSPFDEALRVTIHFSVGEVTSGDEALRADLEEVTCAFHGMVLCQEKSQNVRLWCNLEYCVPT